MVAAMPRRAIRGSSYKPCTAPTGPARLRSYRLHDPPRPRIPADVEKLRSHNLGYVYGLYPKKRVKGFGYQFLPGAAAVPFGRAGGLHEVRYAGLGFTLTRWAVYEAIRAKFQLPECNRRFGTPYQPYFQPMVIPDGERHWYLTEDYAFGERARQAGASLFADTTIRLLHVGTHANSWDHVAK
jgi:hypothetical protein